MSKAALHDLVDPGKWDWGDLEVIPYLNSSRMILLKLCPRLYHWKITKRLGVKSGDTKLNIPMAQGSLYHAMAQAHDAGDLVLEAIRAEAQKVRVDPTYQVSWSEPLDYLVQEMYNKWYPKYQKFMQQYEQDWDILMLEKELHVPCGKFILSCIPDKVVQNRETGEIWVVERKTTARDDSSWDRKWALNAQTTAEVLAVEKTLDKPVAGVYLEQVVVTRKRSSTWTSPNPQPIHSHMHYLWRPVPKSQHVKDEFVRFGESISEEIRWRYATGREWDTNYASCERCEAKNVCLGRVHPSEVLEALEEDYVAKAQRLAHGISRKTTSQVISKVAKEGSDGI